MIAPDRFRSLLLQRRDAFLRRREDHLSEEQRLIANRWADWVDLATDQREAGLLDSLSELEQRELREIHTALQRLERGTYGTCEKCLGQIGTARLLAVPETRLCAPCSAEAFETSRTEEGRVP